MNNKKFCTTYAIAANWLGNKLILCNDIPSIDNSVFDNVRFELYDEENDCYNEIYQWFLTDCSQSEVEYLEEHFGLQFTYSDMLGLYVLCVDHWGTSWDYVTCFTDLETAKAAQGSCFSIDRRIVNR